MTPLSAGRAPVRPALSRSTPAQFLPGVGPRRADLLMKLGVRTIEDLVHHVPREYVDARQVVPIARLVPGRVVTVVARVEEAKAVRARARTDLRARVADATGRLGVTWFGQGFLSKAIRPGTDLVLVGELAPGPGRTFANPAFEILDEAPEGAPPALTQGRMLPRYALTAGISARMLRRWMVEALRVLARDPAPDPLPEALRTELALPPLATALADVHAPADPASAEQARRRLAFDELLAVQLVLARRRQRRKDATNAVRSARGVTRARAVIGALPFTATAAQKRAVNEIVRDMQKPVPMHRLLVGDVGAGKTVVALLAAACAIEAGHQVAFMAPTEILAEQHFRTLTRLGEAAGIAPALWTGATGEADRRAMRRRLRLPAGDPGALDLVVGTHALLEPDVPLPRLGLVVVDEQHRFGVAQRARLAEKTAHVPDVLVMTATPIPRSLALAFLGDLDVSVLDERPAGRTPVVTKVTDEGHRDAVLVYLAQELAAGRQAYVVAPLIEESEKSELRAARAVFEQLSRHPRLAPFRFALLHGRLKPAEKESVMRAFAAGEIDALVATTVIEVGVDVPNASVMLIEHPERFGLTQLHQLRGRIGRGAARSVCILLQGARTTPEAAARLALLAQTADGFRLAEEDMKSRGTGELWGARQTGMPAFRVADLVRDADLVERARTAAERILGDDPELARPAHRPLAERIERAFAEEWSWRATG